MKSARVLDSQENSFQSFLRDMNNDVITIVSGLPRSGTSMMMQMLAAGGLPVLCDNCRAADEDNPRGYYEFERVKLIRQDVSWLPLAKGKAVKIISELLRHLPPNYSYRVIFMQRRLEEILASQHEMLIRRGRFAGQGGDKGRIGLFHRHLTRVASWLKKQSHFSILRVDYGAVIANPTEQSKMIARFLDNAMAIEDMARAVDPSLYRQRR
ncbi:MAG: sulfotransferase family protein [candidate division KSB1 bacterium]|nr:sulfotransferase family protein [candidate division KSB1 bacterium]MDZ7365690.1 sulfotransferase family protein [candidate division KSB1 bacterium]MDZ7403234.1 sulfotransferase family protein [candidate division KSB1 bacterium]